MPRRSRNGGPRSSHTLRPVRRRKKMHGLRPFASWSARSCEKTTRWPKRPRGAFSKKKSTRSGGADTRSQSDRVGSERGAGAGGGGRRAGVAPAHGVRDGRGACAHTAPVQRPQPAEDGRRGPRAAPRNTLSRRERDQIVAMAACPEFCNTRPHPMVPRLADRGEYLASASSFYRVLKTEPLRAHRGRATPSHRARPRAYAVTAPRTLCSWDLTYLLRPIRGAVFLFVSILGCLLSQGRGRGRPCRGIQGTLLAVTRPDLP